MSRAFVKEPDGSEPPEDLPERAISPHRNFVTANGLHLIEDEIKRLNTALEAAGREDKPAISRDLNYWLTRRASAELVEISEDISEVRFGHKVVIRREDNGKEQAYRITGQDEADPAKGLISYVSPLAIALLGKAIGDIIELANGEAEITGINI